MKMLESWDESEKPGFPLVPHGPGARPLGSQYPQSGRTALGNDRTAFTNTVRAISTNGSPYSASQDDVLQHPTSRYAISSEAPDLPSLRVRDGVLQHPTSSYAISSASQVFPSGSTTRSRTVSSCSTGRPLLRVGRKAAALRPIGNVPTKSLTPIRNSHDENTALSIA